MAKYQRFKTKEEKLHAYLRKGTPDECWEWTGSLNWAGYGQILWKDKDDKRFQFRTHRLAWVAIGGRSLTEGMVLDHVCRNRKCCNPRHLREVSPKTNALENSGSGSALNKAKTRCPRGHTYNRSVRRSSGRAQRVCGICAYAEEKRRRKRLRQKI